MTLQQLREQSRTRRPHADEEHRIQCACVQWFRIQHRNLANLLFAVPNGGARDKTTGARLKAEGVLPGVADLLFLYPSGPYHGLAIEMKTPKGRQQPSQHSWQLTLESVRYRYAICRSLDDFIREITEYLQT